LLDKIMLFKVKTRDGIDFTKLIGSLNDELPHFAKWLLEWDADAHGVLEYSRFGVTPYHHPELLEAAREVMPSQAFYDMLKIFLGDWFMAHKNETEWLGNPTKLMYEMAQDESMKHLISKYNPVSVGRMLSQLANQGYELEQVRADGYRLWSIKKQDLNSAPPKDSPTNH
jgi:biotin operon repressor